ncbi:thiamine-phosphate kinase [Oceanospirillum multiglobuliferum]|uniref:Thiamine-monophosphate kinase n=1 Tax=Oceanospirillum multiglobuliferum TaxID=64969 RepID=A0A1T4S3E2_9GAMM|nr:thiamine-phosphate kinase [Oceanospirillum multiglobuliferum]OPX54505.1 thiamine-phosphate kinase [Oceanospirillum multiglobuliferum]SKA22745.1 thiamine-phosphate kinase [Oceanospirillum multiglobuliferum]
MGEFELINRFFRNSVLQPARRDINLAIGDDCALISVPQGKQLAVSVDTSIAGVHFLEDAPAFDIGWRALAVSLSDLAAMGAKPAWFTLALTLPNADQDWLKAFADGMAALASRYGIALVGGDTTRGAMSITVQVQGYISQGGAWLRSGAKVGDIIYVSGTLGDAAGGLHILQSEPHHAADETYQSLIQAYLRPEPRFDLLPILSSRASSAIDISDGFLADLQHILTGSRLGAQIDLKRIPISEALKTLVGAEHALKYALTGGDDYQLCFTVSPQRRLELEVSAEQSGLAIHPIGVITAEPGIKGLGAYQLGGFDHFAQPIGAQ